MDVVGVMTAYLCVLHSLESASLDCAEHKHTTGKYAATTPTTSISTAKIEPLP